MTGIDFVNRNTDDDSLNIFDYLYYYNGAGVAVGDINNDGLPDIYFASNRDGNKLYLNKGNFKFDDITAGAAVKGNAGWTTGVTMADVNGDGWLDIYVCTVANLPQPGNTGHSYFKNSGNRLFINNRDNTFTESAKEWGLDIQGLNTQAVFFDYDNDGWLDMFLLQHSVERTDIFGDSSGRHRYSEVSGSKLFHNDHGHFRNVTKTAGIISSTLGYGLGVAIADLDNDGYDDIYVSNDFHENDYYYVNRGNGTFREMNSAVFGHNSKYSMGNDIADINNDGWLDIMTVDMLPEDEKVLKSSQNDQTLDNNNNLTRMGYHFQLSRNCLQLNTGYGRHFSDIALYSGVAATDWSWGPLIADYNLDGYNDIFISNGIKSRQNDLDNIKFNAGIPYPERLDSYRANDKLLIERQPSGAWHNYIFEGNKNLQFQDRSMDWGFGKAGLSQGAAYADLDGDGALDLITNNMNEPAGIYRNNTRKQQAGSHYLALQLRQNKQNVFAIGAKVFLFAGGKTQYKEMQPVHGFMSSMEPLLHYGLGTDNIIDSIVVIWPDNRVQRIKNPGMDKKITILYDAAKTDTAGNQSDFISRLLHTGTGAYFTNISAKAGAGFVHQENTNYIDFYKQPLIPHEISTQGPKIAVADVNADGLEDFYICGAKGQSGKIFLQRSNGTFRRSEDSLAFETDKNCEDVDAIFFDANGDGHPDLYVTSGGNEYEGNIPELNDRLYINDGKGKMTRSAVLPSMPGNKSVVRVADFDRDGDTDIFVGGRSNGETYGLIPASYLLENDGCGHFKDATDKMPGLRNIGMVTDGAWVDIDHDGWPDLIVVGEWMAPILFKNNRGKFIRQPLTDNDKGLEGWWCSAKVFDANGDGFPDLLLGNYGLNSKLTASEKYPLKMFLADINGNKRPKQILAIEKGGKYFPFLGKEALESAIPSLKKKYLSYSAMAGKTIDEIFGAQLDHAKLFTATTMASTLLLNDGSGKFKKADLPFSLQWGPVFSFGVADYTGDGKTDFIAGGNFYGCIPYEGRYDAMSLCLYIGDGKGGFQPVFPLPPVFYNIHGEIRDIQPIALAGNKKGLLIAINNAPIKILQY